MTTVYHNTIKCQSTYRSGEPCRNNAYYSYNGQYVCGVHSKKDKRVELPKDPDRASKQQKVLKERERAVKEEAKRNREKGVKGKVICTRLRMMKQPENVDGFLKVFPNFKHGNRKDGFGCKTLSPKDMGPIEHNQPDLPTAFNLENFHQGNKVFPSEVNEDGDPSEKFFETQKKMYEDATPHRHKKEAEGKNKNVPLYSVWRRPDNTLVKLTYFESRQFYCTYYERIAKNLPEFKKLKTLLRRGYNLQICGYDAYRVTQSVEEHYLDTSRPFGHELVLYTLLTVETEEEYPWRKYTTERF